MLKPVSRCQYIIKGKPITISTPIIQYNFQRSFKKKNELIIAVVGCTAAFVPAHFAIKSIVLNNNQLKVATRIMVLIASTFFVKNICKQLRLVLRES
jgi:uncharacterized membrane protein YjjP (DUF1212 family)